MLATQLYDVSALKVSFLLVSYLLASAESITWPVLLHLVLLLSDQPRWIP